jgi:hypothetical protein
MRSAYQHARGYKQTVPVDRDDAQRMDRQLAAP